ncbi:hypothetical protein BDA99DRAFT_602830 [Phascolomyces articulosus]|uniref:Uncharacterized protein n=1 Tax=Phascolomyces articulosus TaxID=60185 RepID=A0AAD5K5L2_9FUNG|nr:hypothetical protein BDA99DRAFT_602830 [Phascolomyces articulosus]
MNSSPPTTTIDDNHLHQGNHAINIHDPPQSQRPTIVSHTVEEQLLSLSPSSPKNAQSFHHHHHHSHSHCDSDTSDKIRSQSEALQQTFDDLDRESYHSHNTGRDESTDALYVPVAECPIVTPSLYIPLPTTIRHYLHDPPSNILPFPPYPLRTRQPINKRLQRIPKSFISGALVTHDDHFQQRQNIPPPLRKRHSLASGQIDRLVHAHRNAIAAAAAGKAATQVASEPELWWPVPSPVLPSSEEMATDYFEYKPTPPASPEISISPPPVITSPPKHPFEK